MGSQSGFATGGVIMSMPLDVSMPLDDVSMPLDDMSMPLDDVSVPLDDVSAPLEEDDVSVFVVEPSSSPQAIKVVERKSAQSAMRTRNKTGDRLIKLLIRWWVR